MSHMHLIAYPFDIAAIVALSIVSKRRSVQSGLTWALIAATIGVELAGGGAAVIGDLACAAAAIGIATWALLERRLESQRWLQRAKEPILLRSPFRTRWRVAAGGPDPRHNHHQVAQDQYFAYDFIRVDGTSWDEEILAPCEGLVAWCEDRFDDAAPNGRNRDSRNPAGNYVSIETARGYVLLGHLKRGSVCVRIGDEVRAGTVIGRCGNSGNTTRAHLHLHAQDRPQIAVGVAQGIPVAFADRNGVAQVLNYGAVLAPERARPAK